MVLFYRRYLKSPVSRVSGEYGIVQAKCTRNISRKHRKVVLIAIAFRLFYSRNSEQFACLTVQYVSYLVITDLFLYYI